MDKQTALEILIANACCSSMGLTCEDCPLWSPVSDDEDCLDTCKDFTDAEIVEAVKVLKGGVTSDGL